ncbi:ATP-binding protein [Streptomyces sp. NPDC059161]|uniref:ATP-binding protein n=1 Tax=Streptomyces sp. NPDC059161 TaxID=3346749 RepID=UPI00368934A8
MTAPIRSLERAYSLSIKRGWNRYANEPDRVPPALLSTRELAALSSRARLEYEEHRAVWHANIGPIRTPQLQAVHQDLWNVLKSNRQDGDKVRPSVVIDAFPGLGKSTIATSFGRDFHRAQIDRYGPLTEEGQERVPVVRIQLTDRTNRRDFNSALCRFFTLPGYDSGNANQLGNRAADTILSCETKLIIVDDVHFLDMRRRDDRAVANHFKSLASTFPVTFLHVGVGLEARGLLDEGLGDDDEDLAQNGRRLTPLTVEPFEVKTEPGRRIWRDLLLAVEKSVVLANTHRGMIADDLSDELFARSTGHFASLMALIARGCERAIKDGEERLTVDVLNRVKNDAAAEKARLDMVAAFESGRLSSRPGRRSRRQQTLRTPA